MTEGLYYKHSGKFSFGAILAGLLIGLAAGLPLAFIYAYVALYSHYIPFVRWGTFLLAAVFGAIVGFSTAGGLHWGKARNEAVEFVTSLLVGLVALYVSWAVWIYALLRRAGEKATLLPLVVYPPLLWDLIVEVNKLGARSSGAQAWVRVDLHACPPCRATNTLTVKSTTVSVDKEGKKSESSKDVVDKLLISSSDAIRQLGQKFSAAAAPAASS